MTPAPGVFEYTRTDMIKALQRIAEKLGRPPTASPTVKGAKRRRRKGKGASYPEHKRPSEPCSALIIDEFGTWNEALKAAGLPLNTRQPAGLKGFGERRFSDEELLQAVAKLAARVPVLTVRAYDAEKDEGDPSGALVRRRLRFRFGTWAEIVEHVGGTAGARKVRRHDMQRT